MPPKESGARARVDGDVSPKKGKMDTSRRGGNSRRRIGSSQLKKRPAELQSTCDPGTHRPGKENHPRLAKAGRRPQLPGIPLKELENMSGGSNILSRT